MNRYLIRYRANPPHTWFDHYLTFGSSGSPYLTDQRGRAGVVDKRQADDYYFDSMPPAWVSEYWTASVEEVL
jgi:hypothetical protein